MPALTSAQRREQIWSVIRVSSGNFLEMYDFFVFGYYASAIGRVLLPDWQRIRAVDVGLHDLRGGLFDADTRAFTSVGSLAASK